MIQFPNPAAARSRWKTLADELNAAQPITIVVQGLPDGRKRNRHVRKKVVSASVRKTGRDLISLTIGHMHKVKDKLGEAGFSEGVPGFFTNRVELAALWGCSERTAYDHLVKLEEAGLIQNRRFRGTKADFEIHLSEEILFGQAQSEAALPAALKTEMREKLPLSNVMLKQRHNETETSKGCGIVDETATNHGESPHSEQNHVDTKRQQPVQVTPDGLDTPCHGDIGAGGAAAATVDNSPVLRNRRGVVRTAAARKAIFTGYVNSFWLYAKNALYQGRTFTPIEERAVLQEIFSGVYRGFQLAMTEEDWDAYQSELFRRVEMAAGYFQRHPDKYCPDPYSRYRAGTGYFAWENLRGFRNTANWLEETRKNHRTAYVNQRVSLAIRHLQQHQLGRAPKMLQKKSYLEAYRYLEKQIQGYGQIPLARFLEAVASLGGQPKSVL